MPIRYGRTTTLLDAKAITSGQRIWPLRRSKPVGYSSSGHRKPKSTLRLAIIGSGPAGFYTARRLMSEVKDVAIDMYEQLPVPFGLVRFGVAPDHPEVKNCQDTFAEMAEDKRFTFIGNIKVGDQLPLRYLVPNYHAIVFAYGASKDRQLGLGAGADDAADNVYSARAFVGWYNGLPEYRHLDPDLTTGDSAVIIGQGNVAMDVARTLLTEVDVLRKTDITGWALERLAQSRLKHVRVVGRRGPLQAAFTIKEVRELMQIPNTHFRPIPKNLFPPDIPSLPRPQKRLMQLLQSPPACGPEAEKSWGLDFLLSPKSLNRVEGTFTGVNFTRNVLSDPLSVTSAVRPDSEHKTPVTIPASVLFRSIGYQSEPMAEFEGLGVDFDLQKGVISHDGLGRIIPFAGKKEGPFPRLYCTGWVKRGPTGVIASTMSDAFSTAEVIATDWASKPDSVTLHGYELRGWAGVKNLAQKDGHSLHPIHWQDWKKIDEVERQQGQRRDVVREKLGTVEEMLDVLKTKE